MSVFSFTLFNCPSIQWRCLNLLMEHSDVLCWWRRKMSFCSMNELIPPYSCWSLGATGSKRSGRDGFCSDVPLLCGGFILRNPLSFSRNHLDFSWRFLKHLIFIQEASSVLTDWWGVPEFIVPPAHGWWSISNQDSPVCRWRCCETRRSNSSHAGGDASLHNEGHESVQSGVTQCKRSHLQGEVTTSSRTY